MKTHALDNSVNDFLQVNKPGIDGYGSNGVIGERGESGNSIFFSAYDCLNEWEAVKNRIISGIELSNNDGYTPASVKYNVGDIILDRTGTIYVYSDNINHKLDALRNIFNTNIFKQININAVILNDTSSGFKENSKYEKYDSFKSSPYLYHRYRYYEYEYGTTLSVTISNIDKVNIMLYEMKTVVILPNGRKFEKTMDSGSNTITVFIPDRMFDGCNLGDEISTDIRGSIKYNGINSHDEMSAREYFADFISKDCQLYIEAYDKVSGRIYRKYIQIMKQS